MNSAGGSDVVSANLGVASGNAGTKPPGCPNTTWPSVAVDYANKLLKSLNSPVTSKLWVADAG
jgi:hypothetical protein